MTIKMMLPLLLFAGLLAGVAVHAQIADTQQQSLLQAIEAKQWDILPEFNDRRAAEALAANLDGENPISNNSLPRLGSLIIEPLLKRLHDPQPKVREQVRTVLTQTYLREENGMNPHDPRLIDALVTGTTDADADVRRGAFRAILRVGMEPSGRLQQAVIAGMTDTNGVVRNYAFLAASVFDTPAIRDTILQAAQAKDAEQRERAVIALGFFSGPDASSTLLDALADPATRAQAAYRLGCIGEARAVVPICALLRDKDDDVVGRAFEALDLLNSPDAIPALITHITAKSSDMGSREYAARILGKVGMPALEPLLAAWVKADRKSKPHLALALAMIPDPRTKDILVGYLPTIDFERRLWIFDMMQVRTDPSVVPLLAALAEGRNQEVALSAIGAIHQQAPGRNVLLLGLLQHPDPRRRAEALYSYSFEPGPIEPELACLQDRDASVREAAAYNLQHRIPDPRIAAALVPLLKDRTVRVTAAVALANQHDARGTEVLLEALKSPKKRDVDVCADVLMAFYQIHEPRAVPQLIALLGEKDLNLRIYAIRALGKQKEPAATAALLPLLHEGMHELLWCVIDALADTGDPAVVEPLIAIAQGQDSPDAGAAIDALGRLKDPRAIPVILQAMHSPWITREKVIPALISIGNAASEPARKLLIDPRPWVREAGAKILAQLGKPEAGPVLEAALADPDPEVRAVIVEALGTLRSPNAAKLLPPLLADSAAMVRQATAHALGQMGEKSQVPALRMLLTDHSRSVRYAAAGALAHFGDEQGILLLLNAVKNEKRENRKKAIMMLGEVNDPRAFDALINIVKDPTEYLIHETAIDALGHRGDTKAIGPLMNLLHRWQNSDNAITALQQLTGLPYEASWHWEEWWYRQQQVKQ